MFGTEEKLILETLENTVSRLALLPEYSSIQGTCTILYNLGGLTPRHNPPLLRTNIADSPDGSRETVAKPTYGIIELTSESSVPQREADIL